MKKLYQFFYIIVTSFIIIVPIESTTKKSPQKTTSKSAKQPIDLLIHHGTIVTMDKKRQIIEQGSIAITNGRIIDIGAIEKKYTAKKMIDAKNSIVMPGLINGHTHAPMVLLRGIADDLTTKDWLQYYIFPIEAKQVNHDFCYWGTQLACLEMIQGGTTTFVDMYYFEDTIAQAVHDIGMRIIAGQTIMDNQTPDSKTAQEGIERAKTLVKKWKNNDLVSPAIAPHAPYTVSANTLQKAHKLSTAYNIPLIIHLLETTLETDHGPAYLERLGVLSNKVIAAHVVRPTTADITALKKYGAGVIHCPVSNMKLASGISPVTRMHKENISIGLGTDGAASNNTLDMFAEMKIACLLQKAIGSSTDMPALQALEMATINGARAIHKEHEIGSIEKGKRADIIIINKEAIHQTPLYNILSQLVYTTKSSDVQTVIINGKILMHNRVFAPSIQEKKIRKHVKKIQKHIVKTVSIS